MFTSIQNKGVTSISSAFFLYLVAGFFEAISGCPRYAVACSHPG